MAHRSVLLPESLVRKAEALSVQQGVKPETLLEQAVAEGLESISERHVLGLYRDRQVSLQKAAEMLGVDMWTMIDRIGAAAIHLDYGAKELREDLGL